MGQYGDDQEVAMVVTVWDALSLIASCLQGLM